MFARGFRIVIDRDVTPTGEGMLLEGTGGPFSSSIYGPSARSFGFLGASRILRARAPRVDTHNARTVRGGGFGGDYLWI